MNFMNERMSHEIYIFFIALCVKCVFNAWYSCVKNTNYEWTIITQFPLLSHKMLSLWFKDGDKIKWQQRKQVAIKQFFINFIPIHKINNNFKTNMGSNGGH
jgi:hypothetical protein